MGPTDSSKAPSWHNPRKLRNQHRAQRRTRQRRAGHRSLRAWLVFRRLRIGSAPVAQIRARELRHATRDIHPGIRAGVARIRGYNPRAWISDRSPSPNFASAWHAGEPPFRADKSFAGFTARAGRHGQRAHSARAVDGSPRPARRLAGQCAAEPPWTTRCSRPMARASSVSDPRRTRHRDRADPRRQTRAQQADLVHFHAKSAAPGAAPFAPPPPWALAAT